jgi:hypothetical protein
MNKQKLTLYDWDWQNLRVSLLKSSPGEGGFTGLEGTRANLAALKNYLGTKPSKDKLWRVLNLLNAVRMGNSGQGKRGSEHDKLVAEFRDRVSEQYKTAQGDFQPPSEESLRVALAGASTEDLQRVAANLGIRKKLHSASKHREELGYFLGLLQEELDKRQGP